MTSSSFIYDLPRRLLPLHCRHVRVSCTDLFPLYNICVRNLTEIPALIMRSLRRSCPGARRILTNMHSDTMQVHFRHMFSPRRSVMNAIHTLYIRFVFQLKYRHVALVSCNMSYTYRYMYMTLGRRSADGRACEDAYYVAKHVGLYIAHAQL